MGDIRARLTSLSLSLPLFAIVGLTVGCGDNTRASAIMATGGAGGTATGGAGGTATGGAGGTATDGGATDSGATGGAGGMAGAGGTATGGAGGGATGGAGGSATGGGAGGAATGGAGGAATGGSGGGLGGAGGSGPPPCYATTFTAPASGATLTVANDSNGTCADGFQYTVTITSGAPDGTNVSLYDGSSLLKTVQVSGGAASFAVQLGTGGTAQQLSIQYPSTQTCTVSENVTVNCPNSPPTCSISQPVISATHPDLNGVPTAQGGDRSSSPGSNYQATFVVSTSAEDGQAVTLAVDMVTVAGSTPVDGTPAATVSGGTATFGLTLVPDGTYEVVASCLNKEGITGTSTKSTFTVDTTPPDLIVNSPSAGQFVVGGTVAVCAQTDSSDAAGLAGSLGAGQNNLCVTLGSSATPSCTPVATVNTSTCINFACPGSAPFSLSVTLSDAAGNPTTQTITGVTCASTLPSVQIVAPASDAPNFTTVADHILNANTTVGVPDEVNTTPGAQADVVACTDTAGTATLLVGHVGDATLTQLGSAIPTAAAASTDNCPSGLGFVARFAGVTLPESNENGDGTLAAATRMQVTVTASGNAADTGTSGVDDVWVDSELPNLALISPVGLCGSFTQSASTVTDDVAYTADDKLVVADVTNNGTTTTYDAPAFMGGIATFGNVIFAEGQNTLAATESDPAGNVTTLPSCVVTIGAAPVVTFTNPTAGALLCPSGATATGCIDDADTGSVGWQGTLTVHVTASGANVNGSVITFTDGTTNFGTATTDANGNATLTPVTVPEGIQTIVATTDNVPGAGVGSGNVTVTVDTTPPNTPTNLTALVLDRRKTSMQLTWTAPSDAGGGNVAGYQIRYAKVPITVANFNDATVTTAVAYTGTPASPGQLDGITVSGLYIENGYYFGIAAADATGNLSAPDAPSTATTAHFNLTAFPSTSGTNEEMGYSIGAGDDVNKDGFSDVIAGTFHGGHAYLFLGSSNFGTGTPNVVFSGSSVGFGTEVAEIGDIDNDGFADIAIADPTTPKVYIYKGRSVWPATLTDAQADYTISTDASYVGSSFGSSLARLGDFTGDGVDDLVIGAKGFGPTFAGRVVIIPGKASGFASVSLPDTTNAIIIDGDSTQTTPIFGYRVTGLGHFYSSTSTTLVVSAPGIGSTAPASAGSVYLFHGQTGSGGSISLSSADQVITGSAKGTRIGLSLSNLGTIEAGSSHADLGIGNPSDTVDAPGLNGAGFLMFGTGASTTLGNKVVLSQAGTGAAAAMIGGSISGRDLSLSLIGDTTPDIIIVSEAGASSLGIADGKNLAGRSGVINMNSVEVSVPLPTGVVTGEAAGYLVPDINGDGYPDFCIGKGFGVVPGALIVFW